MFEGLAEVADFYLALPVMRAFVESNLLHSPILIRDIRNNPTTALCVAYKLRSILVFKEAFTFTVGTTCSLPKTLYRRALDFQLKQNGCEELTNLIDTYQTRLYKSIADVNWSLMKCCFDNQCVCASRRHGILATETKRQAIIFDVIREELRPKGSSTLDRAAWCPYFYHQLCEAAFLPTTSQTENYRKLMGYYRCAFTQVRRELQQVTRKWVRDMLNPVTKNCLVLSNKKQVLEGEYFLCTQLENKDIPWDVSEVDW